MRGRLAVAAELPTYAAWRHHDTRDGFELVFPRREGEGIRFDGETTGLLDGAPWALRYELALGPDWSTERARVAGIIAAGRSEVVIERARRGSWRVDGDEAPHLDGCLDVDLEASSFTNAFPVHRLGLAVGEEAEAPAVWVRALGLGVERLEQRYRRLEDDGSGQRYAYTAPDLDFSVEIAYDEAGLVVDYPAIAVRVR